MKRRLLFAALILVAWLVYFSWQRRAIDEAVGSFPPAIPAVAWSGPDAGQGGAGHPGAAM